MLRVFSILILGVFCVPRGAAQPSNNTCATAQFLTYSGSCTALRADNFGATKSGDATPTCGGSADNDVWFKTVVPRSGNLVFDVRRVGTAMYSAMALYKGRCGSLTQYRCDDNSSYQYRQPYIEIHDAKSAGDTLYVQIWGDNGKSDSFDLCVFEPKQPSNTICDSAIRIDVKSTCSYQSFTNEHAGNSGVGVPTCGAYITDDVWFTAVVPKSGKLILRTRNEGLGNAAMAVYRGACDSLDQYACDDNSGTDYQQPQIYINDTNLANELIRIRVWKVNSIFGGDFGICAFEPTVGANNTIEGATWLNVDSNCNYRRFSNEHYTNSGLVTPSCGGYDGADIWFKTKVPSTGILMLDIRNAGLGDAMMAVYRNYPDSLKQYTCDDNRSTNYQQPNILINDTAIAGDTIYIMVWKKNSIHSGPFDICCHVPDLAPNPDCARATELTVKPSCNFERFNSEHAPTSGEGLPTCGNYQGNDVWFTFEVPSSGEFTIDTRAASIGNLAMSLYTGSCGALTQNTCDDRSSTYYQMPRIAVQDTLLAGQKVYVQVWRNGSYHGGTFDLCVYGKLTPEIRNPTSQTICENEQAPPLSVHKGVFQYNWYSASTGGTLLASDTFRYQTNTAGTYYVEAVNTETLERSSRVPVSLTINPLPRLINLQDVVRCEGDSIEALSVRDMGDSYTWYADSSGLNVVQLDSHALLPPQNGTYYVQATNTRTRCKTPIRGVLYQYNGRPSVIGGNDIDVCSNELPVTLAVVDSGQVYSWYQDAALQNLLAYNQHRYLTNRTQTYYVQAMDKVTGCLSVAKPLQLTVRENPTVVAPRDTQVCANGTPVIRSVYDQGHTYVWRKKTKAGFDIVSYDAVSYAFANSDTVYVHAVHTNGCVSSMDSTYVIVNRTPLLSNPRGFVGCDDGSYAGLKVDDLGDQYNWYTEAVGGTLVAFNKAVYLADSNGTYYVEAKDPNTGCTSTRHAVERLRHKSRAVTVTYDGDSLYATSGPNYQWYYNGVGIAGATSSAIYVKNKGMYYVQVVDSNGCITASDEVEITTTNSVGYQSKVNLVTAHPNPFDRMLTLTKAGLADDLSVEVRDVHGRIVLQQVFREPKLELDLGQHPSGMYTINVLGDSGYSVIKVIKTNGL